MKNTKTYYTYPHFTNIKDMMLYACKKYADNVAFTLKKKNEIDGKKEVEYKKVFYKDFLEDINNLGTGMFHFGLQGKKIGIVSKNRYEWIVAYVTCFLGGMIAVPLDKGLTPAEIESSILCSGIDCIIFDKDHEETIKKVRKEGKSNLKEFIFMDEHEEFQSLSKIQNIGKKLLEEGNRDFLDAKIEDDALAELVFTSGTSSQSKIVMLSQNNIAQNLYDLQRVEYLNSRFVNLAFLPYHHKFGSSGQLLMLSVGMSTAFPDGLRYIAQNLREYKVSFFVGVPALIEGIYKKLMHEIEKQGKMKKLQKGLKISRFLMKLHIDVRRKLFKEVIDNLGGLEYIVSGAAALDPDVQKGLYDLGITAVQGYGMTEASPVLIAENKYQRRAGSIGVPMPQVDVKIIEKDEYGIGEICCKGPNVMLGYYEDEEKTKETIDEEGWLHTGDLGYMDKDGYVFITGRKKDMIVLKNGKKVFPEELESLVNKLDLVDESMVFAMTKENAIEDDDVTLAIKIKYNDDYVAENYKKEDEKSLNKILWEKIKNINKTIPKYKYIKHLFIEKGNFVKTTTNKIKRNEEMKKIKNEKEVEK